jgi:hypothetical protein
LGQSQLYVAYIAEHALLLLGFIERNVQDTKVRPIRPGRENCARGIDIPLSDIQKLRDRLGAYSRMRLISLSCTTW